jgi:glycerol-3-phosphate dehydrogenase (NAD(P)+)
MGHAVRLWLLEEPLARAINEQHVNPQFLPGITLPAELRASCDLSATTEAAEIVLVVVPSEFCRGMYRRLAALVVPQTILVSATKGFEIESLKRMSEVAHEEIPASPIAVLSGPSFAEEVARAQPTTVVCASAHADASAVIQQVFSNQSFRVYSSEDVVGVELGGALKNIIAIAAGIVDGLGFGHNTIAALITRGLSEISRLAVALGGRADTLAGLSGLGDLVLTCTGGLSRNRRVGQALGSGQTLAGALGATGMVAEGVRATLAACRLAERTGIEMPIAEHMRAVLYEGLPPRAAVEALMLRSLKRE